MRMIRYVRKNLSTTYDFKSTNIIQRIANPLEQKCSVLKSKITINNL